MRDTTVMGRLALHADPAARMQPLPLLVPQGVLLILLRARAAQDTLGMVLRVNLFLLHLRRRKAIRAIPTAMVVLTS